MRARYFITLQTWHCVITILEGDPKLIQLICYLETLSPRGFMTEKAPQVLPREDLQDNSPLIDSNVTSTFDLVKTLLIVFSMSFLFRFRGKKEKFVDHFWEVIDDLVKSLIWQFNHKIHCWKNCQKKRVHFLISFQLRNFFAFHNFFYSIFNRTIWKVQRSETQITVEQKLQFWLFFFFFSTFFEGFDLVTLF